MRSTTTRALIATLTAGAMLAVPAMATAADTTVTFTVASSGTLAIGQTASTATLTDALNPGNSLGYSATLPGVVTGSLPKTTVTDTRGTLAGAWTVAVVATGAFTNQSNGAITIPASAGRAYIDAATLPAMVTALGSDLNGTVAVSAELAPVGVNNLGTSYTLISGTTTLGNGSAAYTPAVSVTVPAATPAGTYEATVRQTVS